MNLTLKSSSTKSEVKGMVNDSEHDAALLCNIAQWSFVLFDVFSSFTHSSLPFNLTDLSLLYDEFYFDNLKVTFRKVVITLDRYDL
jgi:hypothetical protein